MSNPQKQTKIVATIGPATETEEVLKDLILAGMNVARFNTKHSEPSWHNERIARVKKVATELGRPVSILLDLQGPEIRINLPEQAEFSIKKGQTATFTSDDSAAPNQHLVIIPQNVIDSLSAGNMILLDDGSCEFMITNVNSDTIEAQCLHDCTVKHRKTMNTPGVVMDLPSLTDRDYDYLDGVKPELIDFVGLSFVRNAQDITQLRQAMTQRNITADVVAKIENQSALDNLIEIIEAADAVMVARGDLGVEVDFVKLIYWQKRIIEECRMAAKPVITATQMLKSMVSSPRPTRAEVSDVTHAIYDGTDAVMLSEETTIGEYPVKAVMTQAQIAEFNEPFVSRYHLEIHEEDSSAAITQAAADLLLNSNIKIDKLICLTETGRTAKLLSRLRPEVPIVAVTSNENTLSKMTLLYGVTPMKIDLPAKKLEEKESLIAKFTEKGIIKPGEKILLIYGTIWKQPGLTNSLALLDIPNE